MRGTPKAEASSDRCRARTAQDKRSHVPVHVVWEITLACNLKWGHCGSQAGKRRASGLSTTECIEVVRQFDRPLLDSARNL
jgi:MoaA/NifB/PqqE/SkfB family radical SAM enzyme